MSIPNNNTTATQGYLAPEIEVPLTAPLTFEQFIQTVLVGVSGLPGSLVRPKWQINPPKQPDVMVNWLAFGLQEEDADTFAYDSIDSDGNNVFQRMEASTVQCSFYGPDSLAVGRRVRDGLQIGQNRQALQSVNADFVSTSKLVRAPDLVNERWVNRWEMSVMLRAQVNRVYPILYFVSVSGNIYAQGNPTRTLPFSAKEG